MKKIVYLFAILIASIGLVACNQQKEVVKEKPPVSKPKGENPSSPNGPVTKEPKGENPSTPNEPDVQEPKGENPSTPNEPDKQKPEKKVYHNEVFKDVVVTKTSDKITITGKAQVFEGVFQYALYDGDKVVKESNYQTSGAPAWGEFEITFDKGLITTGNATFELFVYSAKDGSKIDTLKIPISKH
ncbi:Gmad2 immunoglobulin-like domain-containing protein [Neobacillus drentensis]|uniref:Gmad2 immunoglobulin-like domain-containing protein n=1 Tax=Neobacillus drentensis TaxID=220684 RepID=UPI00082C1DC4|nr:Gmad2 immunoglobulin-like domain-containing protein [Neobacillus drentensis]